MKMIGEPSLRDCRNQKYYKTKRNETKQKNETKYTPGVWKV